MNITPDEQELKNKLYSKIHDPYSWRLVHDLDTDLTGDAMYDIMNLITLHTNEARIDAVYSMHDSIMRGELQWGNIREDAWLNGTIHKWIDRVIESGDTTSTSHNGKWIQAHLTNPTEAGEK